MIHCNKALTQLAWLHRVLFNPPYMSREVVATGDDLTRVKATPLAAQQATYVTLVAGQG